MEVFAVLCDRGSAAYWKSLEIPVISSAHLATPACAAPIVTRGGGSCSYHGAGTRGVRHAGVQTTKEKNSTPPCSSDELFFAERNGGHTGELSVVDMVPWFS